MYIKADEYLEYLYEKTSPQFEFKAGNKKEWELWRRQLKKKVYEDLGGFPQEKAPLNTRLLETEEFSNYTRQRIVYTTDYKLDVVAYLLLPKSRSGKLPAVIACHGHGYGARDILGLNPDNTRKSDDDDPGYQRDFAIELVERGFIVIAPELFGFGDRRLKEDEGKSLSESSCYHISTYLLMLGKTIAGVRVYDIIRTIDYLLTRSDVDSGRLACMGISGGGLVTAFASALDERIKASVISGYTNRFKDSIMSIHHCVDNFIPGIVTHAELPDIIGLIAPRPLLIESGTKDPIFPIDISLKAYKKIQDIYKLLDVEDRVDQDVFEGEHRISGEKAYDWLKKWL